MKNCIKKSLTVLSIFAAIMMAGCASSGDKTAQDVYNEWRQERAFSENIEKAYAAKRAVTLNDVTYKSELKSPALAASVNAMSATIAAMYLTVVKGVDGINAYENGRAIDADIAQAVANKSNPTTREKEIAKLTPAEKYDLDYYKKVEGKEDPQKILNTVVLPLIKKLGEESAKVAQLAAALKNNPEFQKLAGLEAMKEGKAIVSDADALSSQIADASTGLVRWKDQLMLQIAAKKQGKGLAPAK